MKFSVLSALNTAYFAYVLPYVAKIKTALPA